MSQMQDKMAALLAPISPDVFEFEDQSHLHAGHAGNKGGGHYAVLIVSEAFEGMNRVARQRKVQELLAELFTSKQIHALSVVARTPNEYFH
ncbi:BolA family transcriptional regulator [Kingella negevensis]|uniref:Transcriptional regulator BolA n=1 Tax=Kingella negevensis TaxID=1522312 RepID=A0A238TFC6_9NEIS|nr:BolA family protein [Kingella negevensis]MDK4680188.1 BolA family transcriptional regulator [Kingella negevensis]MDK4682092.1 BolA family transcriptional regulator [Kingella negevensis]MDK4684505.1 BolA family transcriptional regulator [Kingella negevensis]MDK4690288.1 BolA family transcriptional regulator [Kingella negevensis]MDK4692366.1 BolA family transcriptional regulator [Kingella negevensis]